MAKCRYAKICKLYQDNYTCNHDNEAKGYCGVFQKFRIIGMSNDEIKV